jgi:hypothetical protein
MNYRAVACLLLVVSLLPVAGCDKASPVAPTGTILTASANPSQISLTGTSTITVVGRKPDGNPLNPGTEIRLTSDIGTITSIVTTDSSGTASTVFHADGRTGTAKIMATTGGGDAKAEVDIQVGQGSGSKPLTPLVTVSPNNIPVNGSATVTVIARNADGTPAAAGQAVLLTTNLGSLRNAQPRTNANGTATTTLDAGTQAGTATVTAIFGSSDAGTSMVTIRDAATDISVQANPSSVPSSGTGTTPITLTAFVTNSQGLALQGAPVTFSADRGTLSTTGTVFTDTTGVATNMLTLTQAQLAGASMVTVTAKTPSGNGTLLSSTTMITVTGGTAARR